MGAAILAAGAARRFTRPKQLAKWQGETLLRTVAREVCASWADQVAVVLGAYATDLLPELSGLRCVVVPNPRWDEGIASSVRAAAAWATARNFDALAITLCDQPLLSAAHIDALISAYRLTHRSVASYYAGTIGAPAVLTKRELPALLALEGDTGAQRVLFAAKPAAIEWEDGAYDVDTPQDLAG